MPRFSATRFWLNSSMQGKISLPLTFRPKSLQWASMKLSSSSTTISSSTEAAKSRIFFSGIGQTMPSFITGYLSPQTSLTYWYAVEEVMMPRVWSLRSSTRLIWAVSAHSIRAFVRASTTGWRFLALPGIMMYFCGFLTYSLTHSALSPGSTTLWLWEMRVHIFSSTGVSNLSDSS